MGSQGPKALPTAPAAVAKDDAAAAEPLVPSTEPVVREQDRLMPVANVSRIMRRGLPPHAKISDDAKEMVQDCVSEFISFVTGEANERCHSEHRKTVTADDIVWAMSNLGFDDYIAPLSVFVQRLRESEGGGGGGGRGSGRGSRRGASLATLPGGGEQMRPAAVVYRRHQPSAPPQPYYAVGRVPRPVPASSSAPPHFGGRYLMPAGSGQRSMVPYYGGATFQAGGSHGGFYADEASSSNNAPPAPARRY